MASKGRPSPTYYYNYASFLFKNRYHRECNDKALSAINKAIEINPKKHFYELKYLILFVMGNIEEAKTVQERFDDKEGKYKSMKEFAEGF